MKGTLVIATALISLMASWADAESLESAKTGSGLRFSESGGGASNAVDSMPRESAGVSRSAAQSLGLAVPKAAERETGFKPVSAPRVVVASPEKGERSFWDKAKIGGAVVGGAAGAVVGLPAIGSGIPLLIAFPVAGLVIAAGAGIGYGTVALVQWANRAKSR